MKKIIVFIMISLLFISCLTPYAFAEKSKQETLETSQEQASDYTELASGAVSYTCKYSDDAKKIEINGSINYDALVTYNKYTIEIYKIAPNQSFSDVISSKEPEIMASMAIAIKFDLSFAAKSALDRFCKYAVVLRSPSGEAVLAARPKGVNASTSYKFSKKDSLNFKGIATFDTANTSIFGDMGFGTVIIPVFYNKLINNASNGYMYAHEDGHIFFDKEYIDSLLAQIRTYSVSGARVYLQLLFPANTSSLEASGAQGVNVKYEMPNVYSESVASLISTYVNFLTSSFDEYSEGVISGFVVGTGIDRYANNYGGDLTVEQYAKKYAYYLTVVANSARQKNSNIDIVVPISDFNSYGEDKAVPENGYSPSALLENLAKELDEHFSSKFHYSVILETSFVPIEDNLNDELDADYSIRLTSDEGINVGCLDLFEGYLDSMSKKYLSVPNNYIYKWNIPKSLYGNALSVSYAYSFYSLLRRDKVSAFVVSFDNGADSAIEDIKRLVAFIDTEDGGNISNDLAKYLGKNSWTSLIDDLSYEDAIQRKIYVSHSSGLSNTTWEGSFSYLNFELGNINAWTSAAFGKNLRSDYGSDGRRALCQTINKPLAGAHSDLICLYEYDENFVYTPAVRFELIISDANNNGALYEVKIVVGTQGSSVEQSYIVKSGELTELWLNMEEYNKANKASYIKISTVSITGDPDEYTLFLYDVSGYSAEYDSKTLDELITAERAKIRNDLEQDIGESSDDTLYWVVFAIIISAVLIAGVIFIIFRRDDSGKRKRIKNGLITKDQ